MLSEYLTVIEALAYYGRYGGLTVGGVYNKTLIPKHRISWVLKKLHEEEYVTREIVPHRPGVNKHLWKLTDKLPDALNQIIAGMADRWEKP